MDEKPLHSNIVRHQGRRFRRSSGKSGDQKHTYKSCIKPHKSTHHTDGSLDVDFPCFVSAEASRILPPPTPPNGKSRGTGLTSFSYTYQRFKPLPSIGRASTSFDIESRVSIGDNEVICTDSAVDLTPPSPNSSVTPSCRLSTEALQEDIHKPQRNIVTTDISSRSSHQVLRSTSTNKGLRKPRDHDDTQTSTSNNIEMYNERTCESIDGTAPIINYNDLPPEPSIAAPHTVTLSIRLPTNERVQRRFNSHSDTLAHVVQFTCQCMNLKNHYTEQDVTPDDEVSSSADMELSSNSVPKVVYNDLSLTLEEAGLDHNTLLHFNYAL